MEKFIIVLTAPTPHMMFDPPDYFKAYEIECEQNDFDNEIEKAQRAFSLEFKVALTEVEHLLTYKVKAQK